MRLSTIAVILTFCLMMILSQATTVIASPYFDSDDNNINYPGNYLDEMLSGGMVDAVAPPPPPPPQKRACIRRGGNCEHQQHDCCFNSSCRCNLWGANCRCQRMGLFQKWG